MKVVRKCFFSRLEVGEKFKFPGEVEYMGDGAPMHTKQGELEALEVGNPFSSIPMAGNEVVCQVGAS